MFDSIEKLKQEFTDKYVVVDATFPELARFEGHVGQVRTVNMNGRALVEFDCWSNIGWYDIEPSCLKVVPKPDPAAKPAEPAKAPKPAAAKAPASVPGEKKLSPLEMARQQGAAKPAGGAKKSTADILAAARAGKTAAPAAKSGGESAAPAPKAPAPQGKMSTADILAAARAKAASAPVDTPEPEAPAVETPAAEAPETAPAALASKPAASKPAFAKGERPSVAEILAWCREHDTKS